MGRQLEMDRTDVKHKNAEKMHNSQIFV